MLKRSHKKTQWHLNAQRKVKEANLERLHATGSNREHSGKGKVTEAVRGKCPRGPAGNTGFQEAHSGP
jgi:hypothetical protein